MKRKIILILIVFLTLLLVIKKINYTKYEKNYFYLDTYINIKIYSNKSKNEINKAFEKVENIYSQYHIFADKYNEYDNIINVYYLNEKLQNDEEVTLDPKLSQLIKLGLEYYDKTEGYINIASANVIDIWKSYIDNKDGLPSDSMLNSVNINIKDITLNNNTYKKSNNIKIDLGSFVKGYVTQLAGEYLESINIDKYLIDAGGNIKAGSAYKKDNYVIGVQNPVNTNEIFTKLNINNLSVVTSGDYQRYYEYEGKRYNHIINPYTKYPASNYKSVTIISDNSFKADIYSTYLFLIDIEKGQEVAKQNNFDVIWYIDEDNIVKSDNFNYE